MEQLIPPLSRRCLLDGRIDGVSSAFLAPRLRPETLRFTVDAFRFTEEAQKLVCPAVEDGLGGGGQRAPIYITCRLKVTPGEQPPDALNKACSFDAASHS
ncbi:POM121 and ZP3 fusion protein-like [Crotalus tigris]|uniref:POM121 and ZP3 fusion protein-like n=1 Tax=Crotalus tigris TaxID=88082 RepID=UPI00192FAF75|nr:POM121 and ZP3 fusion protein-like [Crotalus tigris]